ncbi:MAG TPA: hypothetical protein VLV56_18565 [Burkholderiales bacterium]|nr:hypothetical protein [Burkholderiales bacterium]
MRPASFVLLAAGWLPSLVAASPTAVVTDALVAEQSVVHAAPAGIAPVLAQAGVDADDRSDFGLRALQQTKQSYVAGDAVGARRGLARATDALAALAGSMQAPGRGEVWMLVNDLRLIRLVEGGANSVTLHSLADAAARAGELAERYPVGSGSPAEAPRN